MKKTLAQLEADLKKFEDLLIKEGPKISYELAQNAAALAIRRIQKEGIDGYQYSTSPILATQNMFNRKDRFQPTELATELGRGEDGKLIPGGDRTKKGTIKKKSTKKRVMWIRFPGAKKAVPVMVLPGGYKQLRQLNGLQTDHIDVTFTGRMIQNIKVLKSETHEFKFLALIGAVQKENIDKLKANRARFGDFLDPVDEEVKIISPIPLERIGELFNQVFNA